MSEITVILPDWFLITFIILAGITTVLNFLNFIMDVFERKTK